MIVHRPGWLDPKDSAYYLGYFLTSWNRLYDLYDKASDAFRAPYDRTVARALRRPAQLIGADAASRNDGSMPACSARLNAIAAWPPCENPFAEDLFEFLHAALGLGSPTT
jgi:hypothetical protein